MRLDICQDDFTKETGIKVESEPTGEAWLVQLEQAARAGVAPADISMMAQVAMLRGQRTELWMPLVTISLGFESIDHEIVEAAQTMGADARTVVKTMIFPDDSSVYNIRLCLRFRLKPERVYRSLDGVGLYR